MTPEVVIKILFGKDKMISLLKDLLSVQNSWISTTVTTKFQLDLDIKLHERYEIQREIYRWLKIRMKEEDL